MKSEKSKMEASQSSSKLDVVKSDFRVFLALVWKTLQLPSPTPIQYDIALYLQGQQRRCVIEGYRGVGKSWITSAYVCWLLLNDPQHKILVVSASKDRSDAFSTFTKRLISEMPVLQHLKPQHGDRDSNVAFDVAPAIPDHSPSVKSVGIFGQLTGSRANTIIADDIEVPNNSLTQIMRDRLSEAIKEFDAILKPGGRIVYLGTPQTEMSIYNLLPERGYEICVWPARYPKDVEKYMGRLAPFITERLAKDSSLTMSPTDPARFDDTDLLEREASYGRSGFALQFMLDTSISDGDRYPLKLSDLMFTGLTPTMAPVHMAWGSSPDQVRSDVPNVGLTGDRVHRPAFIAEKWEEYQGAVMFIDPSGRGADETAYAVVKMLHGYLYVTRCSGLSGGYDETVLRTLAQIAKDEGVNQIIIEDNFGDGMFTQLFKPYLHKEHPCSVEEVKNRVQKELRIIDTLEPVMNQHRLIVDEGLLKEDYDNTPNCKYQLFYQLTRITRDRGSLGHDDRLDALAGAVAYWVERMGKNVATNIEEAEERAMDEMLAEFVYNAKHGASRRGGKGRPRKYRQAPNFMGNL